MSISSNVSTITMNLPKDNVVDKTEVWTVIENDLSPLKSQIEGYMEELDAPEE